MIEQKPKPARFIGSAREDLRRFPEDVRTEFGYAIFAAQEGGKAPKAKPLKGIVPGSGVLEIVEDFDGNTSVWCTPRSSVVSRYKSKKDNWLREGSMLEV